MGVTDFWPAGMLREQADLQLAHNRWWANATPEERQRDTLAALVVIAEDVEVET